MRTTEAQARAQAPTEAYHPNFAGNMLLRICLGTYNKIIDRTIVGIALHRMSVLNLAMCQFELKYEYLPDKLDELVPEFITSVPVDPFDGIPIRWDKAAVTFYSIGEDQSDDGGEIGKSWTNKAPDLGMYYWWSTAAKEKRASDGSGSN